MFQSFINLKGSFVNDEYVVKKFEHVHYDKENDWFQKSRKLLTALDDDCNDQSKGFCICDRLPRLVSKKSFLITIFNFLFIRSKILYGDMVSGGMWPLWSLRLWSSG